MTSFPRLLLISDRRRASRPLHELLGEAAIGEESAIYLREHDLDQKAQADLITEIRTTTDAPLIGPPRMYEHVDGVHLRADSQWCDGEGIRGRSVHSVAEAIAANEEPLDYVLAAPVFASGSKASQSLIGLDGLRQIVAATTHPVLALSGIEPGCGRVQQCIEAGAHGVAVMGALMLASNPQQFSRALLAELKHAEVSSA